MNDICRIYNVWCDQLAEKDAKIAKREADAEKWAGIAGQNQKQINKLADEIERLKAEMQGRGFVLYPKETSNQEKRKDRVDFVERVQ